MMHRVLKAKTNNNHTIDLTFSDGTTKRYDCNHLLEKGQFKILNDIEKFHQIIIDDLGGIGWDIDEKIDSNVIFNNRIDICKDILHKDGVTVMQ